MVCVWLAPYGALTRSTLGSFWVVLWLLPNPGNNLRFSYLWISMDTRFITSQKCVPFYLLINCQLLASFMRYACPLSKFLLNIWTSKRPFGDVCPLVALFTITAGVKHDHFKKLHWARSYSGPTWTRGPAAEARTDFIAVFDVFKLLSKWSNVLLCRCFRGNQF